LNKVNLMKSYLSERADCLYAFIDRLLASGMF
jgi:hypothetical protein